MKRIVILSALWFSAFAALTQQPPAPPKPPEVTWEMKSNFFKAQAWMLRAQLDSEHASQALKEKQDGFTKAINDLQAACGDNFAAGIDAKGDPICQPKASAPVTPPAK